MVKNYNIVGQDFNINLSDRYDLSILVGMDRFFYVIMHENQVLVLRTYHFPKHNYLQVNTAIAHTFQSDKLLQLSYRNTRIGLVSSIATLIPAELYDTSKTRFYLEHNAVLEKEHIVLEDKLGSVGAHHVYAFNQVVFEGLQTHLPQAQFQHVLSGLIATHHRTGKSENVYVNLIGEYLQIVVFNQKKLLFSNTFTHRSESDVLYFIMLVINQLGLDAEKNTVTLSGEITDQSPSYLNLQKYIKHLEFVSSPTQYIFNYFDPPAYHHFFDLMAI